MENVFLLGKKNIFSIFYEQTIKIPYQNYDKKSTKMHGFSKGDFLKSKIKNEKNDFQWIMFINDGSYFLFI